MMECVEGFVQKYKLHEAFDDARKELRLCPEFSVPKRAYLEVTQW